jgi:hypothetical protein
MFEVEGYGKDLLFILASCCCGDAYKSWEAMVECHYQTFPPSLNLCF